MVGDKFRTAILDTQAVQKVMKRLMKTQKKFRKAEMRAKLNDCQNKRVR